MKKLITVLTLMLVAFSFNATAETVSGQFQVTLTIVPTEGCSQKYCAIKPEKIIKDLKNNSNKENYKISESNGVVTIEF